MLIKMNKVHKENIEYYIFNSIDDLETWLLQNPDRQSDDNLNLIAVQKTYVKFQDDKEQTLAIYFGYYKGTKFYCQDITTQCKILGYDKVNIASLFRPEKAELGEHIGNTSFVRFPKHRLIVYQDQKDIHIFQLVDKDVLNE